MKNEFDGFWSQAKMHFVDEIPPLKPCGNCGKEIISRWVYKKEVLLLHNDKTMCSTLVSDV